ncbi:MAG: hypothetical protein IKZ67_04535, partial [Paludibacteraceae bacterium]|nr:hypothetical protein [Paludibacteraceae bacterium]
NEHDETGIFFVNNNTVESGVYEIFSMQGTLMGVINISGTSIEEGLRAYNFAKGSYIAQKKGGMQSEVIILK